MFTIVSALFCIEYVAYKFLTDPAFEEEALNAKFKGNTDWHHHQRWDQPRIKQNELPLGKKLLTEKILPV
jgi:hypothetical protein